MPRDLHAESLKMLFVLDDNGNVVPAPSVESWARSLDTRRRVAVDQVGDTLISTVFLGIDMRHSHPRHGTLRPPLVFETMLFWPDGSRLISRYATRAAALETHAATVAALRIDETARDEF